MNPRTFRDRREAGQLLASKLAAYANRPDVIVSALPRGGVPVGHEVAQALNVVFVVRKIGVPGHEELAMGAVASSGVRILNEALIKQLRIPKNIVDMTVRPRRSGEGGRLEVVQQLVELRNRSNDTRRSGRITEDETFYAEQNARLVKNAEAYYRTMFLKEESSWNLRDRHMVETLEALVNHLGHQRNPVKMVVWAHNSHLGDARATEMGQRGLNVGQLVREQYDGEAVLVGFTTHHGTVTAASAWDGPAERTRVRPALAGSYEALFHAAHPSPFLLSWRDDVAALLRDSRLERAIGVVYRPDTERMSHYCTARLPDQFDVVLHFDETHAVEPLETTAQWEAGEVPETFPFGV